MTLTNGVPHISLFKITSETHLAAESWVEHFNYEIKQTKPEGLLVRASNIEVQKNNHIRANIDSPTTLIIDALVKKVLHKYSGGSKRQETPGTHVSKTPSKNYHITLELENKEETFQTFYSKAPMKEKPLSPGKKSTSRVTKKTASPRKVLGNFVSQVQDVNGKKFAEKLAKSIDDLRGGLTIFKAARFGNWIGLGLQKV
ncbi:hypothetical protein N9Y92_00755 [Chlamydiales bacterium]|nr:hypothetical protein [Chlamydiales bacterium]